MDRRVVVSVSICVILIISTVFIAYSIVSNSGIDTKIHTEKTTGTANNQTNTSVSSSHNVVMSPKNTSNTTTLVRLIKSERFF